MLSLFRRRSPIERFAAERNFPELIRALCDPHANIRRTAACALWRVIGVTTAPELSELKDSPAVDELVTALHNEIWNVRQVATIALGQIGDTRAVEPLIAAVK